MTLYRPSLYRPPIIIHWCRPAAYKTERAARDKTDHASLLTPSVTPPFIIWSGTRPVVPSKPIKGRGAVSQAVNTSNCHPLFGFLQTYTLEVYRPEIHQLTGVTRKDNFSIDSLCFDGPKPYSTAGGICVHTPVISFSVENDFRESTALFIVSFGRSTTPADYNVWNSGEFTERSGPWVKGVGFSQHP